jgi:tRNA(Ile)-lysidine synthetase-like protein
MTEYDPILKYWFPSDYTIVPSFWFSKTKETDDYIKQHFSELLIHAENHKLNHWKSDIKGHLALIILLDQFSRHIYRDDDINVYKNDIVAYHHAKEFILYKKDELLLDLEKMMILFPFRHQINLNEYEFLQTYLLKCTNPIWDNFKKHTNFNHSYLLSHNNLPTRKQTIECINFDKYESILENKWSSSMLLKDVKSNISSILTDFINENCENLQVNKNNIIIVSLSGGVDSMVILYVLSLLKNSFQSNIHIVAVHLDYHNRDETGLEAEFLFRWCKLIDVPLYYRYIHEGSRNNTKLSREEYEEVTKEIRFDLYKKVRDEYKNYYFMGVILGHHKGDLQENIFFNMMKGRTLIDLSVIKIQSEILGVKILRPLLGVPKQEIFDLAHSNNIPYFKNTTPSWSNRGKYREIIQPALMNTFGEGVMGNLSKLSQESDDLQIIIKNNIIIPYMKTIEIKDNIYFLPKTNDQPFTYWKYIFTEFCHQFKLPVFSHKSIVLIYEKLYPIKKMNTINISNIIVNITNDHIIISTKI